MSAATSAPPRAGPTGLANPPGGAPLIGSTDLTNGFDLFKGNGSYFGGLQGGYNFVLPQHVLLGVEADTSSPSLVAGTTVTSNGGASYGDSLFLKGSLGKYGSMRTPMQSTTPLRIGAASANDKSWTAAGLVDKSQLRTKR
jgi:hypothetical protein